MIDSMDADRLIDLIDDLRKLPNEIEWVEFKVGNDDPENLGRLISALSNGARLSDEAKGYLVYGIDDRTHEVVGTSFRGGAKKVKKQPLRFWLAQNLDPCPDLNFHEVKHPDGRVVVVEIQAATGTATKFNRIPYIRIGEATPRLSDHPILEKQLWAKLQTYAWESDTALQYITAKTVLGLLKYEEFFSLLRVPTPTGSARILEALKENGLISRDVGGRWNILNIGACLLANDFSDFKTIQRKKIRLIQYAGRSRVYASIEHPINGGYAVTFEPLIDQIMTMTTREDIGTLRLGSEPFPRKAVREIVANALIHQDMTATKTSLMIEIFSDRIEVTNSGQPLVEPDRFIDAVPTSRNEYIASLMRRLHICEERGSGIDRVIEAVEESRLPAPQFVSHSGSTRATLFGPRSFPEMTKEEKVRACFQHAALLNEEGRRATNASLRARFGVSSSNSAQISRILGYAKKANLIKLADPDSPKGGYVPFFA